MVSIRVQIREKDNQSGHGQSYVQEIYKNKGEHSGVHSVDS